MLGFLFGPAGGVALTDEKIGRGDYEHAVDLFFVACAASNPWGCHDLGLTLIEHLAREQEAGLDALELACPRLPLSCNEMGRLLEQGRTVERDVVRAAAAYRKGCDASYGKSCVRLANLIRGGVVPGGDVEVSTLSERACELGDGDGCANAGIARRATPEEAIARFEKGCTLKSVAACDQLAEYFTTGEFVPVDDVRAVAARAKACALGHLASCPGAGDPPAYE
ncbi:MAG: tetratricopeptide repeat protein [Polyangiaceae bacterium]